jgi:6-phosphogluconolactonase
MPIQIKRLFLQPLVSISLLAMSFFSSLPLYSEDPAKPLFAYVGTFSSPLRDMLPTQVDLPPGNGRGIHCFRMNRTTGELTPIDTFEMGTSPSCLAIDPVNNRLYSANETDSLGAKKHGTVSSFAIDPSTGKLQLLNTVSSEGAGPTYVSLHPSGKFLLVANYFGGSVAVLPIRADGQLGKATDVRNDEGSIGPTKAVNAPLGSYAFSGHDRTHAHMIETDPSGNFVLHVDLGQDRIYVWSLDIQKGTLNATQQRFVSLPAGDGPRHFYFHPNRKWFYSIQEEGSTIALFDFNSVDGVLTHRQTISSLPKGYAGSNFCSEILVSRDGRFVYGGNRLHDSIGIFSVGKDGGLTHVADEWTRGNYPRSFSFDPSGNFLFCCNQRADNVTVFRVETSTGLLQFTGQYIAVGNPSMIAFAELGSAPKP